MADGYGADYPYNSTTAFFHIANGGNPELLNLRPDRPLPALNLPYIPRPFTILSSSSSFILCRGPSGSYHLFDPLAPSPLIASRRLIDPPRPHHHNPPAIVSVDLQNPSGASYHIICAIEEGAAGRYTFDQYSSYTRNWIPAEGEVNLGGRRIVANTGVSCGRWVYWLTEAPQSVVMHDLDASITRVVELPESVRPETRLQLGRVGGDLGLVLVDSLFAQLYLMKNSQEWNLEPLRLLKVELREDASSTNPLPSHLIVCREIPLPLRFDSCKLEVLFWVDGRLVMWEGNGVSNHRTVAMNVSAHAAANGVPYVRTVMSPPGAVWPSNLGNGFLNI